MNVTNLFISAVKKFPNRLAIVEIDKSISYLDLEEEVIATAAYFQEMEIKKGDRVLVFVPMSIDLYRIVLALFYIGATAVFLDEWVSKKRLELCCELADCKGFIGVRKARIFSLFSKELRRIPIKLQLAGRSKVLIQQSKVEYDSSALITFTTGSTGTPKAADRSHGFLREQFNALIDDVPSPQDVDLPVLPIVLFVNLGVGCTSVIAKVKMSKLHKMNTQNIANQIIKNKVNRITSSPSFIHKLTKFAIENKIELQNIEKIFTGGGPVFPNEASLFEKAFPNSNSKIVYGSTEAEPISSISANELKASQNDISKGLPVGKVYAKTQLKIIPFTKETIPKTTEKELLNKENRTGEMGEIIVAGNHVLKSYFNNPKAFEQNKIVTEKTIWHRTGDCGFLDNGNLFLLGRCEQVIEYQGKTYSPFVIEYQLKQINGIETGTVLLLNNELSLVIETDLTQEKAQKELEFLGIEKIIILKKIPRDPRHHTKIDYGKLKELIS
jgi:acyl-CoA synthetase (AMP-forming)/AMP-acid ligase II